MQVMSQRVVRSLQFMSDRRRVTRVFYMWQITVNRLTCREQQLAAHSRGRQARLVVQVFRAWQLTIGRIARSREQKACATLSSQQVDTTAELERLLLKQADYNNHIGVLRNCYDLCVRTDALT